MPSVSQFKKEVIEWHDSAILEDFDEEDDDFSDEEDFDTESDAIFDEFEIAFEEKEASEVSTLEKEESEVKLEEKERKDYSPVKQTKIESDVLSDEIDPSAQQENVNFQATPSFYRDLYKESQKDKTDEKNDAISISDDTKSETIEKDIETNESETIKRQKELPKNLRPPLRKKRSKRLLPASGSEEDDEEVLDQPSKMLEQLFATWLSSERIKAARKKLLPCSLPVHFLLRVQGDLLKILLFVW